MFAHFGDNGELRVDDVAYEEQHNYLTEDEKEELTATYNFVNNKREDGKGSEYSWDDEWDNFNKGLYDNECKNGVEKSCTTYDFHNCTDISFCENMDFVHSNECKKYWCGGYDIITYDSRGNSIRGMSQSGKYYFKHNSEGEKIAEHGCTSCKKELEYCWGDIEYCKNVGFPENKCEAIGNGNVSCNDF